MAETVQADLSLQHRFAALHCGFRIDIQAPPEFNWYCGMATIPVIQAEHGALAGRTTDILGKVPQVGQRLERRTARDLIAGKLKTLIATNMLLPGDPLPSERELADVLKVSRETIRGAIQILAAQGFIEVSQGSRSRVLAIDLTKTPVTIAVSRPIDSYDLESVHAARLLMELQVVGEAAIRIDEVTLAKLDGLLETQSHIDGDVSRFLICDREFHVAIYRACGNPLLADLVTDLYTYMIDYRRMAMGQPNAIEASLADHLEIVSALKAHDRRAVIAAFHDHLMRIYESTKAMQENRGQPQRENK